MITVRKTDLEMSLSTKKKGDLMPEFLIMSQQILHMPQLQNQQRNSTENYNPASSQPEI